MKTSLLPPLAAAALLMSLSAGAEPADGAAVLRDAAGSQYGGNTIQTLKMTATGKSGRVKERTIQLQVRREAESVWVRGELLAPESLKGTRFVMTDAADAAMEVLLYLPALKSVTPIRGEKRAEGFMGTDFALADLSPPDLDAGTHTLVSEDETAWVVESVPAEAGEYARVRATLHKSDRLPHVVEYFAATADATPVKRLELLSVGDNGLPSALKMTDLGGGTSTVMEVLSQEVDVPEEALPLTLFTKEGLKQE